MPQSAPPLHTMEARIPAAFLRFEGVIEDRYQLSDLRVADWGIAIPTATFPHRR
jgi:hypothetical protein